MSDQAKKSINKSNKRSDTDMDVTLQGVRALWQAYPHMRLCQLLTAAAQSVGTAPFYIEDDDLPDAFAEFDRSGRGR